MNIKIFKILNSISLSILIATNFVVFLPSETKAMSTSCENILAPNTKFNYQTDTTEDDLYKRFDDAKNEGVFESIDTTTIPVKRILLPQVYEPSTSEKEGITTNRNLWSELETLYIALSQKADSCRQAAKTSGDTATESMMAVLKTKADTSTSSIHKAIADAAVTPPPPPPTQESVTGEVTGPASVGSSEKFQLNAKATYTGSSVASVFYRVLFYKLQTTTEAIKCQAAWPVTSGTETSFPACNVDASQYAPGTYGYRLEILNNDKTKTLESTPEKFMAINGGLRDISISPKSGQKGTTTFTISAKSDLIDQQGTTWSCYFYIGDGGNKVDGQIVSKFHYVAKSPISTCQGQWQTSTDTKSGLHTIYVTQQKDSWEAQNFYTSPNLPPDPKLSGVVKVCDTADCAPAPTINIVLNKRAANQGELITIKTYIPDSGNPTIQGRYCYFWVSDGSGTDTFALKDKKNLSACLSETFSWDTSGTSAETHQVRISLQDENEAIDHNSPPYAYEYVRICPKGSTATCEAPNLPGGTHEGPDEGGGGGGGGGGETPAEKFNGFIDPEAMLEALGIKLNLRTPTGLAQAIIFYFFPMILGIAAFFGLVYGGIQFLTSEGDAKKAETAKKTILYCVIGVVMAILSVVIVEAVINQIKTDL